MKKNNQYLSILCGSIFLLLFTFRNLVMGQSIDLNKEIEYFIEKQNAIFDLQKDFLDYAVLVKGSSYQATLEYEICRDLSRSAERSVNNIELVTILLTVYRVIQSPTDITNILPIIEQSILTIGTRLEYDIRSINTDLASTKNNQVSYSGRALKEQIKELRARLNRLNLRQ